MKELFTAPEIEVIEFAGEDIITSSDLGGGEELGSEDL